MATGNGKKGKQRVGDVTVEILKQIRDNTAATTKRLEAVESRLEGLDTRLESLETGQRVLIEGQHDLAQNVAQLNTAMTRVLEEVKYLRDDKYDRIERRLAAVEQQLAPR